ncbi:hypothetical protein DM01DRAFT_86599 [Hesseltinella vesiculosa]|uniref:Uncharacterized protein n=1 Tax=Hesseltinella vesiculosa TaxID=101127 RepID=A0A1X2GVL0_9FUNG|nr:hypothetical protein DM01DRAFT_86599 [Hesseltinella vesiculosa]
MPLKTLQLGSRKLFHRHKDTSQAMPLNQPPLPPPPPPPSASTSIARSTRSTRSSASSSTHTRRHRSRTTTHASEQWTNTLQALALQNKQSRYNDVVGSFFFTDRRCQMRALFLSARLQRAWPALSPPVWEQVMNRLYTWNYVMYVVPKEDPLRRHFLHDMGQGDDQQEEQMVWSFGLHQVTQLLAIPMSTHQQHQTQSILTHALQSENKLTSAERDAMYLYHALRAGFDVHRSWTLCLDEEPLLLHKLKGLQLSNSNPFEDSTCIVVEA